MLECGNVFSQLSDKSAIYFSFHYSYYYFFFFCQYGLAFCMNAKWCGATLLSGTHCSAGVRYRKRNREPIYLYRYIYTQESEKKKIWYVIYNNSEILSTHLNIKGFQCSMCGWDISLFLYVSVSLHLISGFSYCNFFQPSFLAVDVCCCCFYCVGGMKINIASRYLLCVCLSLIYVQQMHLH